MWSLHALSGAWQAEAALFALASPSELKEKVIRSR
jgi:hypothetical protein